MFMPCDKRIGCEGSDFPIANFTSEDPDRHKFIGINWGWDYTPVPPLRPNGFGGGGGGNNDCVIFSQNFTSQQNADICSITAQIQCTNGQTDSDTSSFVCDGPSLPSNPNTPDQPPSQSGKQIYWNTEQTCIDQCADGTTNTFMVQAGTYNAYSQTMADRIANSFACDEARKRRICMATFAGFSCVNVAYSFQLDATGQSAPFTFSVVQGTLPDGLTLETDGTIHGIPTSPGNYVFTIQATSSSGIVATKEMTFEVLGIISYEVLPTATQNSPYSFQLVSGSMTDIFSLGIGSLPDGLTLSTTGLISGTPTTVQGPTFGVIVTDDQSRSCIKYFVLDVAPEPVSGLNWDDLLWGPMTQAYSGAGNGHFNTPSVQSPSFDILADAPNGLVDKATIQCIATLSYNGPAVNCQVTGTYTRLGPLANSICFLRIEKTFPGPTTTLFSMQWAVDPPGPFVVPDTGGNPITIRVTATAQAWSQFAIAGHLTIGAIGTISNV